MSGNTREFNLLLLEQQIDALTFRDDRAEQEPCDRENGHQNLELVKIIGVNSDVRSRYRRPRKRVERRKIDPSAMSL